MPALTPRETDFVADAPFRLCNEVTLTATPEEAWAVLTDNERWPEWYVPAKECRTTSDVATGVGATRWAHVDLFKVNERIVAWEEPTRWSFTILDANLPGFESVVEDFALSAVGEDRTHVTYTFGCELKAWMRPLTPILKWRLGGILSSGIQGLQGQIDKLRTNG